MKKLLLLSLMTFFSLVAANLNAAGLWDSYVFINGTSNKYFLGGANNSSSTAFGGLNLGNVSFGSNLTLNGGYVNTWRTQGSQNICGGTLYYRVYPTASPSGSYTAVNLPYDSGYGDQGNNQQWYFDGGTANLAAGLAPGNYTIEMYAQSTGDDNSTSGCGMNYFQNNGGNNFKATFTVTNAGNVDVVSSGGTSTFASYSTLAAAITAINGGTIHTGTITVYVTNGYTETAPAGGFSITATGTASNPITFRKSNASGANPVFTASASPTAGALNDAVIKITGGDYITIDGFTLLENANTTTTAGSNNMTEWGIALLYASATNGCQNVTIQNCTIDLNRTYQNSFGIYANSTHTATTVTTSATATGATGGNHNLKIYGNSITDVNMGIVVTGPTAAADQNTGLDIGGTSTAQGNTITNYGTTGSFSSYANVSGTVNGILVRNSNGFNISYNTVTSSVGGVTSGTLNGIQIQAASNTPNVTFTNNINNNSISLKSAVASGVMNGINYPSGSASTTSIVNINNNDFNNWGHTVTASGVITFITSLSTNLTTSISNNTFTNISVNTTGNVVFISNAITLAATGTMNINGNSVVTGFSKTGAGGTITFFTSNASSATGSVVNMQNNNISNITATGSTGFVGINNTDGGSPTKTITGNTFNNISGGTGTINPMTVNFLGATSSVSSNIITNISWGAAITALSIGSSSTASVLNVSSNTINNISSTSTVIGLSVASPSTITNVNNNTVHTLSSTGASAVTGINITGATTTNVFKNNIYGLSGSNASSTINGIVISAGTTVNAYNNFISNLNVSIASASTPVYGINVSGGTTVNLTHNTVRLNPTSSGANFGATGIGYSSSTTFALKNNIININATAIGTGTVAALRRSSGTANTAAANLTASNNIYYVNSGAQNFYYVEGTTVGTSLVNGFAPASVTEIPAQNIKLDPNFNTGCGLYKSFMGAKDQNSFTENNLTAGSTAGTFAPSGASYAESAATLTTTPSITVDFADVARSSTPDIGALEFNGTATDASGPTITYTAVPSSACAPIISATITDASGVNTTVGTKPRLWYKRTADATTGVASANDNTTTGWKFVEASNASSPFTFAFDYSKLDATPASAETISYFVAAQDNASTPNVGNNIVTFSGGCPTSVALSGLTMSGGNTYTVQSLPTSVATSASATSLCFSGSPTLSLTPTGGVLGGLTYEWYATGNASVLATTATYTPTITATTEYYAKMYCNGAEITANGSPSTPVTITVNSPNVGTVNNGTRCGTGTVDLSVTGNNGSVSWYGEANGGTALGTGTTFTTPSIATTTTYYVDAAIVGSPTSGGARVSTSTTSGTTPSSYGLVFNATSTFTLNSVNVYLNSTSAGNVVMVLQNNLGTQLQTATIAVPAGNSTTPVLHTLNLGWTIPVGTGYRLLAVSGPSMIRESSLGGFPYAIGTVGSVTNGYISGTSTNYYYFYNWNFTEACSSPRTAVTATVTTPPTITTSATVTRCANDAANTLSVSSSNDPNYTYAWSTGDNGASTNVSPTVTTTYTLTASDTSGGANNGCITTGSVLVNVNANPTPITFTPASPSVCNGSSVDLTAVGGTIGSSGSATIGTATTLTSATTQPTAFCNRWTQYWCQTVFTAAELQAQGMTAGNINSITYNITTLGDGTNVTNFSVHIGNTANSTLSGFTTTGLTQVYGPATYNHTIGANTITFTTPYPWDGVSNIILDIRQNGVDATNNAQTYFTATTGNTVVNATTSNSSPVLWTNNPSATTSTSRLNTIFGWSSAIPTTLAWSPSTGLNTTTDATVTAAPTATTTYSVVSTSAAGCTASNTVDVTVNQPTSNVTDVTVCDSYTWSVNNQTYMSSGTYSVTSTNTAGCVHTETLNLTINVATSNVTDVTVCDSYTWSVNNQTYMSSGTYSVTSTNAAGCVHTEMLNLTVNVNSSTDAGADVTVNCITPSTTLTASGGVSYEWDNGASQGGSVSPMTTTTYTVTVTDANGCTATDAVVITADNSAPMAMVSPQDHTLNCTAPTAEFAASGGVSYLWSNGETSALILVSHPINATSNSDTYSVTVTGANGCTAVASGTAYYDFGVPTANAGADVTVNCANPSANLTAMGGAFYNWSNGETTASVSVSPTVTTTYSVTVTGSNGCTSTDDVEVAADFVAPTADAGADATVTCANPNIYLVATGGVNYVWNTGEFYATILVNPTVTTTYMVTVTGSNGCTSTDAVTVNTDLDAPIIDAGADVTVNCTNPSTTLMATGGVNYVWDNGATQGAAVSPTMTTTYTVTVTGANGCTSTDDVVVTADKTAPTADAGADATVTCSTPTTTLNAMGGVSYAWSNGTMQANTDVTPMNTTTYTVTVTSANGCTSTDDVVVTADKAAPAADAGADVTVTCSNPSATLTATGGVNYAWDNGVSQGGSVSPMMTTTYTVTVTGANGCTATDAVVVTADKTAPAADAGPSITLTNLNPTGTLTASGGVSYSWSNGQTTASISVNDTNDTVYSVTVTGANGCTAIDDVSVFYTAGDITPPTFTFVPASTTLNCQDGGTIKGQDQAENDATATDDYPGVTMSLVQVSTKNANTSACNHYRYTVTNTWTATDASGNTATASQVITVDDVTGPTLSAPPANMTVSINGIPDITTSTLTASDNCSTATIGVLDTDDKLTVVKPACTSVFYNITRTWTATDVCGNTSTTAQIIHVEDQVRLTCPSSKKLPATIGCQRLLMAADLVMPTFSDVCDLSNLTHSVSGVTTKNGSGSVAGTLLNVGVNTITYTANFAASVSCSFDVTIEDKTAPALNVTQPIIVVNACSFTDAAAIAAMNASKPSPSDNCSLGTNTVTETASSDVDLSSTCKTKPVASKYLKSRTITYSITDAAGNSATATQVIYLRDNTAPTASCKNDVTVTIGNTNVTVAASTLNSTTSPSSDNCTAPSALVYSACLNANCTNFSTNLTFTKAMLGTANNSTRVVTLRVTDACGNNSTCTATVTLKKAGTMAANSNTDLDTNVSDANNSIEEASDVVTGHGEMKCFPNPFAEDLSIQYNLTDDVDNVVLKLYDNQGRVVGKLDQGASYSGLYSVRWNLSHLDAGMYHVCLEMNGECVKTQRVLMMK